VIFSFSALTPVMVSHSGYISPFLRRFQTSPCHDPVFWMLLHIAA
jgi:hypothetical protein